MALFFPLHPHSTKSPGLTGRSEPLADQACWGTLVTELSEPQFQMLHIPARVRPAPRHWGNEFFRIIFPELAGSCARRLRGAMEGRGNLGVLQEFSVALVCVEREEDKLGRPPRIPNARGKLCARNCTSCIFQGSLNAAPQELARRNFCMCVCVGGGGLALYRPNALGGIWREPTMPSPAATRVHTYVCMRAESKKGRRIRAGGSGCWGWGW